MLQQLRINDLAHLDGDHDDPYYSLNASNPGSKLMLSEYMSYCTTKEIQHLVKRISKYSSE